MNAASTQTNGANGSAGSPKKLLEVNNLVKHFPVRGGLLQRVVAQVRAVEDVSFHIFDGETFGLVGESGCGKTTVGRTILRLVPATGGSVTFEGQDVFAANPRQLKQLRRNMQIIFQDPYSSLDPRMPVGESIGEGLLVHGIGTRAERFERVIQTLRSVGMQEYHARRYPHRRGHEPRPQATVVLGRLRRFSVLDNRPAAPAMPANAPIDASMDAAPLCCCCGGRITVLAVYIGVATKAYTIASSVVTVGIPNRICFSSPSVVAKSIRLISSSSGSMGCISFIYALVTEGITVACAITGSFSMPQCQDPSDTGSASSL